MFLWIVNSKLDVETKYLRLTGNLTVGNQRMRRKLFNIFILVEYRFSCGLFKMCFCTGRKSKCLTWIKKTTQVFYIQFINHGKLNFCLIINGIALLFCRPKSITMDFAEKVLCFTWTLFHSSFNSHSSETLFGAIVYFSI